jgi:hypothetical protein
VHIDDWIQLANAEAIIKAGSITCIEPFYGKFAITLGSNLEFGFQLFWGYSTLRNNGISLVYTEGECKNPDLTQVRDKVYLLEK